MQRKDEQGQQPPATAAEYRKPYEPPRLQAVELLPEETLGIGCKNQIDDPGGCGGFNHGS